MAWNASDIEKLRMEFVMVAREPDVFVSNACRQFCISRKTGYKWLKRYESLGLAGLSDRARGPRIGQRRSDGAVVTAIVALRNAHPEWGPGKILARIRRDRGTSVELPCERTIARILEQTGLVKANRRGRPRRNYPREGLTRPLGPNDVWTVDLKGWWRTRDGSRCEPLTVCDLFSRYLLCVKPMRRTRVEDMFVEFAELFSRYGLPRRIRNDNGAPFASITGLGGLTRLSAWWRMLGIVTERIEPGHPEQNGAHERMHLEIAKQIQSSPARTVEEEEKRLAEWRVEYNSKRPHAGIENRFPSDLYRLSPRRLEHWIPYCYPAEVQVRTVRKDGSIKLNGQHRQVSQALAKQKIGLKSKDCNRVEVWFCDLLLGELDLLQATPLRPPASASSPADQKVLP